MPNNKTQLTTRRNLLSQAVSLAIATQLAVVPMTAIAEQISPNPNAAGNIISISVSDANNNDNFDNHGTVEVVDGGVLTNLGDLKNHSGGSLKLSTTTAGADNLINAGSLSIYRGGSVDINGEHNALINQGSIDNSGTLTNSGTLSNSGNLSQNPSGVLNNTGQFTNNAGGLIDNYGVFNSAKDDLTITNDGTFTNLHGGKLSLTNTIENSSKRHIFLNTGSLINTNGAEILLEGSTNTLANQGTLINQTGGVINVKDVPNSTASAYNTLHNRSSGTVENQYGASIIFAERFTYLDNQGTFNNSGNISSIGSTYINNRGTLNNLATGRLVFDGSEFTGNGSLVNDGTVEVIGGNNSGMDVVQTIENRASLRLKSITLRGQLNNQTDGSLLTQSSLDGPWSARHLKVASGGIYNRGAWNHAENNHIINEATLQNESTGTLNLGGTIDNTATFTNAGTVNIDATASLYGIGSFAQSAGTTTVNGLLASDAGIAFDGGVLSGSGQINVAAGKTLQVAQAASISPAIINDDLTVNGDLALDGTIVIDIESNSTNAMDVLTVTGNMDFGVNSDVVFRFHFTPVDGDTTLNLNFLNAGSVSNYSNLTYSFEGISNSNDVSLVQVGNDLQLQVNFDSDGDGIINENDAFPNDGSETADSDGDGTGDNADIDEDNDNLIDIVSLADLDEIRRNSNGTSLHGSSAGCLTTCNGFELINDLDFDTSGDGVVDASDDYWNGGEGWTAIGGFRATLEGNNYKIKNLTMNQPQTNNVGLFNDTNDASTIRNLHLENVAIQGANNVGALIGKLSQSSSVENVTVTGTIQGHSYVGGLFGWIENSQVTQVSHVGQVIGTGERVGGIVGYNDKSTLSRAYHMGEVSGVDYVAGIVGAGYQDTVQDVFAVGTVIGDREVGGIIGRKNATNLQRSFTLARVSATTSGGAVIGHAFGDGGYSSSFYDRVISLNGIGINADDPDISQALSTKEMSCPQYAGDIACSAVIYSDWDDATPIWDFGDNSQLPTLVMDGIAQRIESYDYDEDGVNDAMDLFPTISIGAFTDTDGDGAPDNCDSTCLATGMSADEDDDNDGVIDVSDAFPLDSTESADNDGDGTGNNADDDDDNDGYADADELLNSTDPYNTNSLPVDNDGDFISDLSDDDDDNDNVVDSRDAFPLIAIGEYSDTDNDGAPDDCDTHCQSTGMSADIDDDNNNVIEIASLADLDAIRDDHKGNSLYGSSVGCLSICDGFELIIDLDFDTSGDGIVDGNDTYWNDGAGWLPIGQHSGNELHGNFDGQNHKINNLTINRPQTSEVGLFRSAQRTTIKDLQLTNVTIQGADTVGGLLGKQDASTIKNISVTGHIQGQSYVGGVIGWSVSSNVSQVYHVGRVTASAEKVGGIVGFNDKSILERAYNIGPVTGTNFVAGITGVSWLGDIRDVFSVGKISGDNEVAGILGRHSSAKLNRSYSLATINATTAGGALIGQTHGEGEFTSSYSDSALALNGIGIVGDVADTSIFLTINEMSCPQVSGDNGCSPVIFSDWDDATPIWDLGDNTQLPALMINGVAHRAGDFDGDGVPDVSDEFPLDSSAALDTDGDGIPNISDDDDDNDGWSDVDEQACDSSAVNALSVPTDNDSDAVCDAVDSDDDNDGMPDAWEISNNFDPLNLVNSDAGDDADGDGISNLDEYRNGTDPRLVQLSSKETELMLSPRYHRYGVEVLNDANCESNSLPVTYTINNEASTSRQLQNVLFDGISSAEFTLLSTQDNCSGQTLLANSSCSFQVVFCPTSTGNKAAVIAIATDDVETPVLSSALFDYESNQGEAQRRLPPVLSMLTITDELGETVFDGNLIEGKKYDFSWQLSGYHDSFYSLIAFFNCHGVNAGDCGASSGNNFINSGFLTNPAIGSDIWSYNGITAKTFSYSYQLEVPSVTENTEMVVRFYRKSNLDVNSGNGALSLMLPGNLDANYYDSSGRRISLTIVNQ